MKESWYYIFSRQGNLGLNCLTGFGIMDSLMKLILFLAVSVIIMDWLLCFVILTNERLRNKCQTRIIIGVVQEKGVKWTRIWLSYHKLQTQKIKDAKIFQRLWCSDTKWDLENGKLRIAFEHMIYIREVTMSKGKVS